MEQDRKGNRHQNRTEPTRESWFFLFLLYNSLKHWFHLQRNISHGQYLWLHAIISVVKAVTREKYNLTDPV